MRLPLSSEEKRMFLDIAYVMDDRRARTPKEIIGVPIPKNKLGVCLESLTDKGLFSFDGKCYKITNPGMTLYEQLRNAHEKSSNPGRLAY